MKKDFETSSQAPVQTACVDAIKFVMDNLLDWDSHNEHDGLRFTYQDSRNLGKSLKATLRATCPDVDGSELLENYSDMLYNGWAGEYSDIKQLTLNVITAFMEAELGNFEPLKTLDRELDGKVKHKERNYGGVPHVNYGVPVHTMANVVESKDDNARNNIEGRTDLVQELKEVVGNATATENSFARRKFPGLFKILGL